MSSRSVARRRSGFTLVELLVVIAIIGVLMSILIPSLHKARAQSQRVYCMSQLRQIMLAVHMYAQNNKGYLPGCWGVTDPPGPETVPVTTGTLFTGNYLVDKRVWICPVDPRRSQQLNYSYTYNGRMLVVPGDEEKDSPAILSQNNPRGYRRLTSFRQASRDITFGEENISNNNPDGYQINDVYFTNVDTSDNRHIGLSAVAYLDGHCGDIPPKIKLFFDKKWGYCR